jgi:hypothetical protein
LRKGLARYREARKALDTPASAKSRRGLDWMNFFLADVQTGFGSFVAFYLAQLEWSPGDIGIALTVGGIASVVAFPAVPFLMPCGKRRCWSRWELP